MLAIIEALKQWKIYLQETKHQTIIKLNHKNLQYFMTIKKLNEQQAWWVKTLTEYDFIIQYCKKKNNSWADILSRRSDFVKKEIKEKEQIMLQANQEKQLEYAHYWLIQIKELLNKQIKKKTSWDKFTKKIIKKIKKHSKMKVIKKLLLFQKLIYISFVTRKKMIEQYHDNILIKYFEIDKIMKLIFRNYYFLQIR